jgi:hypothetical protein
MRVKQAQQNHKVQDQHRKIIFCVLANEQSPSKIQKIFMTASKRIGF